ncbi:hypothetical protein Tco_0420745 [Tanacetum coccineum]
MASSHTGNHREDDFTSLETIRRFIGITRSKSLSSSKGRPLGQRGGMVKLTTFAVLFKAYGGETSLDWLQAFLNLGPAGDWLTLSNRGVPSKYPELLLEENKLSKKSFKDVVPLHVWEDLLYNQITTYPCNVRTFPDPILFLAGLKSFWEHSPKKPIIYHRGKGIYWFNTDIGFTLCVNNEVPIINVSPLNSSPPSHVDENVGDSDDVSSGGGIVEKAERLRKSSKVTCKRKQAIGPSVKEARHKLRKAPPQTSKVASDASDPIDVDSDPDIHGKFYTFSASSGLSTCDSNLIFVFPEFPSAKELKYSTDCYFFVAQVTPSSWKQHLRDISQEKLSLESSCSPSHEILTLDLLRPIELQGIAIVDVIIWGGV